MGGGNTETIFSTVPQGKAEEKKAASIVLFVIDTKIIEACDKRQKAYSVKCWQMRICIV